MGRSTGICNRSSGVETHRWSKWSQFIFTDRGGANILGLFKVFDGCNEGGALISSGKNTQRPKIKHEPVASSSRVSATCIELRKESSPRSIDPSYSSILEEAIFSQHLPLESATLAAHSVFAPELDFKTWLNMESAQSENR